MEDSSSTPLLLFARTFVYREGHTNEPNDALTDQQFMLEIDKPVTTPLTRAPNPYFLPAALLSILVHALLIFFIQRNDQKTEYKTDVRRPIHVYFQTSKFESNSPPEPAAQLPSKTAEQSKQEPIQADPNTNSSINKISSRKDRTENPVTQTTSTDSHPEYQQIIPSGREKSFLLPNSETFICNPKEKETLAINCNQDPHTFRSQRKHKYQIAISSAFKRPEISVSQQFKRDINRVESLLDLQERLEDQMSAYPNNEVLIERHRAITNEIQMIDQQYEEVNLPKVLGSGIKAIRNATNKKD